MKLRFSKMQGCGNDFLILDNMNEVVSELTEQDIRYFCHRNFGVGADGLVIFSQGKKELVKWEFYNSDASEAEMCGNAARCAVRYLADRHFPDQEFISFETRLGVIKGKVLEDGLVEVAVVPNHTGSFEYKEKVLEIDGEMLQTYHINVGVPHAVTEVKNLRGYPVSKVGSEILNHPAFLPEKTNVTFFQRIVGNRILSTTFERGVEKETLACGTGAAAAAVIFSELYMEHLPVEVNVPGGNLSVDLSPVSNVLLLRGPAQYVFDTTVEEVPHRFSFPRPFEEQGAP